MLEKSDIQAVIIGTPMNFHAAQSIAALKTGHGGGDFFEIMDFVDTIMGKKLCPIGIDQAMDMTLPELVSQQSILENGRWLEVPDSRNWE
ncbi:MAG: hypothetical protein ACPL3Q_09430 [Candidatus Ratteibacteria bacterium]